MTNVERYTGGKSLMTAAAVVGVVGLALTGVGAMMPSGPDASRPRFSAAAFESQAQTDHGGEAHASGSHTVVETYGSAETHDTAAGLVSHTTVAPTSMQEALASYLVAFMYWLGISVGALLWLSIFHAAHARWMVILRRPMELMAAAVPIFVVLFIPIALGMQQLFLWAHPTASLGLGSRELFEMLEHKRPYLNLPFFYLRAVFYFLVWAVVSFLQHRWSTQQDAEGGYALTARQRLLGAGSLPLLAITITFAAFDWLMSLNPFWISTIFGAYYFAGSFLAALAVLTLATTLAQRQNLWGTLVTGSHYHSLGKLLFGFTIFWTYIAFSQFMLIWIANLPEEGPWYLLRMKGAWWGVSIILAFSQFLVPFVMLLAQDVKKRPRFLASVSLWILLAHYVDLYWLALPTFHPEGVSFHWTAITAFAGVGGVALAFAIARARGSFTVPVKDPYLNDSLRYAP